MGLPVETRSVCKDTNNGFSVQVNWNELNEGMHTVALCVDGAAGGSSVSVVVTSDGPSFLRGFDGLAIVACTQQPVSCISHLNRFHLARKSPKLDDRAYADMYGSE